MNKHNLYWHMKHPVGTAALGTYNRQLSAQVCYFEIKKIVIKSTAVSDLKVGCFLSSLHIHPRFDQVTWLCG